MPVTTQQPISKKSPQQPQPATPRMEQQPNDAAATLDNLERDRDPSGQKARASETYAASAGGRPKAAG